MKETNLLVRLDDTLKNSFKKLCIDEGTTMSNKVQEFIKDEVKNNARKNVQEVMSDLLSSLNYKNVKIIAIPTFLYNRELKMMIDSDSPQSYKNGSSPMITETFNMSLGDFLEKNKNKKVFLYAAGSDFYNNKIRACVID